MMRRIPFLLYLAMGAIVLLLAACDRNRTVKPVPSPSLTVSPTAVTVVGGGEPQTFSATLQNSTDTISWELTGNGSIGSITPSEGASTVYTPPASVAAAVTATLTAMAGELSASATITINPASPGLVVSPTAVTVVGGGEAQTFSATLQNSTDTISWELTGNGSIAPITGASTVYTPPDSVATRETATLTATAGELSATASITINPPSTITVEGQVLKFNGEGASGINVRIHDAVGNTLEQESLGITPAATDGSGKFTIKNVTPPYKLSVVPRLSVGVPQTWDGVNRKDPIVVVSPFLGPSGSCSKSDATIDVSLWPSGVAAGHTGQIIYIAEGISHYELSSYVALDLVAGQYSASLIVPFDNELCSDEISGKLIYLERDSSTLKITNTGTVDTAVGPGELTSEQIIPQEVRTKLIAGTVSSPDGVYNAQVTPVIKVGGASFPLWRDGTSIARTDNQYQLLVPNMAGVDYRILAFSGGISSPQFQWAYSDVIRDDEPADLTLPVPVQIGRSTSTSTPTFSYTKVDGTNLNYVYVQEDGMGLPPEMEWLGATHDDSITLPALVEPALLTVGTRYYWSPISSINVRGIGDPDTVSDDMLDGRLVKKRYFGFAALENPDVISAGSYNFDLKSFTIE